MSNEKTIYELGLHEALTVKIKINNEYETTMFVTRVPGGFIYSDSKMSIQTFVPWNDDLKSKKQTEINQNALGNIF